MDGLRNDSELMVQSSTNAAAVVGWLLCIVMDLCPDVEWLIDLKQLQEREWDRPMWTKINWVWGRNMWIYLEEDGQSFKNSPTQPLWASNHTRLLASWSTDAWFSP